MPLCSIKDCKNLKDLIDLSSTIDAEILKTKHALKLLVYENYERFLHSSDSMTYLSTSLQDLKFQLQTLNMKLKVDE